MKICIIIPTLQRGGAERVAAALANYLAKKGNSVTLVTFDNNNPGYQIDKLVSVKNIYLGNDTSILNIYRRILLLRSLLKETKADVVLSFFMKTTMYALLARTKKVRIIGSERSNPFFKKKSKIYKYLEKILLPWADGFIFLTKEAKFYYPQSVQRKSTVIPNGIFIDDIDESIVKFEDRKLNEICAVGRLHPVKDYPTMIRAFSIFSSDYNNYSLKIYGEGSELCNLMKLVKELNLENKVQFMGIVEDVAKYTADSGMYILTSKSESWCNALMESLALGIPCIATDCDFGPRAMIQNGINGILTPVGDANAIADAMSKIANNHKLAQMFSNNALKIRKTHSAEKILDLYNEYIKEILKK